MINKAFLFGQSGIKKWLPQKLESFSTDSGALREIDTGLIGHIINQDSTLRGSKIISVRQDNRFSLASALIIDLMKDNVRFICKADRFANLPFVSRERQNLKKARLAVPRYLHLLPTILSAGFLEGFNYSVFPYYAGYQPSQMNRICRRAISNFVKNKVAYAALEFLTELGLKTKKANLLPFSEYAQKPMEDYLKITPNVLLHNLAHKHLEILKREWASVPLLYVHGDFTFYNLILQKIKPLQFKIMDWESLDEQGFPAIDLVNMCISLHLNKKATAAMLRLYCAKIGLGLSVVGALRFLSLIKIREKLITENKLHLTTIWAEKEKDILCELLVSCTLSE